MKNSGIKWVGEIPSHWETKRLGALYTLRSVKVSDKDYSPLSVTMKGILPQLDSAAKTNDGDNRKLVCKGDFVINSRSDRRGSCGISPLDGSVSLINLVLCPKENMIATYYNWLFHTSAFSGEFYRWGHGIVDDLWTTRWSEMRNIYIPYLTLSEQKAIAEFLDKKCGEIDELVGIEEQTIAELQAYKQAIITEAVTKGIGASGDEQRGGRINIKLSRLCTSIGGLWIGERKPLINVGVIRNANFTKDFKIDYSKIAYIDVEASSFRKRNLQKGDLIVEKSGGSDKSPVGRTIIYEGEDGIYSFSNFTMVLRIIDKKIASAKYLYYYLLVLYLCGYMNILQVNTTGLHNLITEKFLSTLVCLPPLLEQQAIAEYLDKRCEEIDSLIEVKRQKIAELKEYKKSVIYEYVTGKKEII